MRKEGANERSTSLLREDAPGVGRIRNSAKNGLRGDQSGGRQEDELGDDEDGDEDSNADKRHGEYGLERRQQTRPNGKGVEHDCRR